MQSIQRGWGKIFPPSADSESDSSFDSSESENVPSNDEMRKESESESEGDIKSTGEPEFMPVTKKVWVSRSGRSNSWG